MQRATPVMVHREQQRVDALHMTSVRRYPNPPQLDLPNNMRDIFGNETARFTPERARDIALYSENGGMAVTTNNTGFPRICDNGHVDSYDCFGAVSLRGTMQTNVPKPYFSHGTHSWVLRSTYLNMPGGQWTRDSKYIAEDMQKSHYRNLRPESCKNDLWTSSSCTVGRRVFLSFLSLKYHKIDYSLFDNLTWYLIRTYKFTYWLSLKLVIIKKKYFKVKLSCFEGDIL